MKRFNKVSARLNFEIIRLKKQNSKPFIKLGLSNKNSFYFKLAFPGAEPALTELLTQLPIIL